MGVLIFGEVDLEMLLGKVIMVLNILIKCDLYVVGISVGLVISFVVVMWDWVF